MHAHEKGPNNSSDASRSSPTWPEHPPRLCNRKPFDQYTEEDWAKLRKSQDRNIRRLAEALAVQLADYEKPE